MFLSEEGMKGFRAEAQEEAWGLGPAQAVLSRGSV